MRLKPSQVIQMDVKYLDDIPGVFFSTTATANYQDVRS